MVEKLYSLEAIRAAFWSTFHGTGETMFPYQSMGATESECQEATSTVWDEFQALLNTPERVTNEQSNED